MTLARHFKNATSLLELDQLPFREVQSMYYIFYKEREAEEKLSKEEKAANAMGRMIEDNI